MKKGRKEVILSETHHNFERRTNAPHFLPNTYFNRLSSIIQQCRRQNFNLFCTFIVGLITYRHRATVTGIYQAVRPKVGYNSLVKFLSRGKWDADAVAQHLIKLLHHRFDNWVYVYDETQAIKTGNKQFGLHFFRNHRYRKRNTNQSKFHSGHQFGALGLLCTTVTETILFPVWVKLICPKTKRDNSGAVLKQICSKIPRGLIIFDRGFNRRKVFEAVVEVGHHILCRAKSNAVFYRLPLVAKQPKRGRPKKYGKRTQLRIFGMQLLTLRQTVFNGI